MNDQDIVKALYDLIENGANEKDWAVANDMKKSMEEFNEKRKAKAAEDQRLAQIEKQKPEKRFPEVWNFKHVYPQELARYCQTYDLKSLETYLQQLENGQHQSVFKKDSFDNAVSFLRARLNERKSNANPKTPTPTTKPNAMTAKQYTT